MHDPDDYADERRDQNIERNREAADYDRWVERAEQEAHEEGLT
jgi:hypothetical protein